MKMSVMRRRVGILAVLPVVGALLVGTAPQAQAAEFTPERMAVSVSPTTVTQGYSESVTMAFSFCIPDAQNAGDSFAMTMPQVLVNWPDGFSVADGTGEAVLTVQISDDVPAVATYTLTPYGASVSSLCATVNAGANSGDAAAGTYDLDFRVGAQILSPTPDTLTVEAPRFGIPREDAKYGFFRDSTDQCRTRTSGCLGWGFVLAAGARGPVTVTDEAPTGWRFDCEWGWFVRNTVRDDGTRTSQDLVPADVLTDYACSPSSLTFTVDTSGLADNEHFEFQAYGSAAAPGGDGGLTYRNEATVTVRGLPSEVAGAFQSAYIGGTAEGDGIRIVKRDALGNDANTPGAAVTLPDGTTGLILAVRNVGTTNLRDLQVADTLTTGSGTVSDLSCDFSTAAAGAPTSGTTWAGPLAPGGSFECTARLIGVGLEHADTATVSATGNGPVADDDLYYATRPLVSIGDRVWLDVDRDGVQDDGEAGIGGVPVVLLDAQGRQIATTTTDGTGFYSFTGLAPGADYSVEFSPAGPSSFTTRDAGDDDALDSDVDPMTGRVSFTAPTAGANSASAPDDPRLDAGIVTQTNLRLDKSVAAPGPFTVGDLVEFTLTPTNDGAVDALPGWSVHDLLPTGLTVVSVSGDGYACEATTLTCTSSTPLPAGSVGELVTVTARVGSVDGTLRNLAWVTPGADDVTETNALVVPAPGSDSSSSASDNDAHVDIVVQAAATPMPTASPSPTSTAAPPTAAPSPTSSPIATRASAPATRSTAPAPARPSTSSTSAASGGLAATGADLAPAGLASALLILAGLGLRTLAGRRQRR